MVNEETMLDFWSIAVFAGTAIRKMHVKYIPQGSCGVCGIPKVLRGGAE